MFTVISSCTAVYHGCGTVKSIGAPEAQYRIIYDANGKGYKVPSGNYFYTVTITGEDDKNHKVYVSYSTWVNAKPGDLICVE